MDLSLALIGPIGWQEMLIIGVIMLLLFGRRLPEVGRSLGQGITQFKKGLKDVQEDVDHPDRQPASPSHVQHTEPQKLDPNAPVGEAVAGQSVGQAGSQPVSPESPQAS